MSIDLRREHKSDGWYVLYANTRDMYKRENAIVFGEAYSSGFGRTKKELHYLKESKSGEFIRLYESKNLHHWVNDEDIIPMFAEHFI